MESRESVIDIVRQSYGRCALAEGFFDDFYDTFMNSSPQISPYFASTNMTKQKQLLREGISFMILFAEQHRSGVMAIDHIGALHDKDHVNVSPDLYRLWTSSLVKTIAKHDRRFDADTERAWDDVLSRGIRRFVELYQTTNKQ